MTYELRLRHCLFSINTISIHKRFLGNIYVTIHCYDAHTILIVNTADYLCMATSTKVSSEPLSWKPSWEEVQGKSHCITQQPTLDKIMHDARYNTTNTEYTFICFQWWQRVSYCHIIISIFSYINMCVIAYIQKNVDFRISWIKHNSSLTSYHLQ